MPPPRPVPRSVLPGAGPVGGPESSGGPEGASGAESEESAGALYRGDGAGFPDHLLQAGGPDAAERPAVADAIQDGHLGLGGQELGALAVASGGQGGQRGGEGLGQGHAVRRNAP